MIGVALFAGRSVNATVFVAMEYAAPFNVIENGNAGDEAPFFIKKYSFGII
jgi:hypothetical protein